MSVEIKMKRVLGLFLVIAAFLFAAATTRAQTDTTPKKRLKSPATISGFIGGEAHDSYVIHARRGQNLTVQISWRRKGGNRAEFTISSSADFFNSEPVKFGKESQNGKSWSGIIPKTGNYYIYIVAHPTAKYTLKVSVK